MSDKIVKQHRRAEFKEIARDIIWNDREKRKYGHSVDTAGAIARALEKAYQRGRKEERDGEPLYPDQIPGSPIEWKLIPSLPRRAFWSVCLFILGRTEQEKPFVGGLELIRNERDGRLRWVIIRSWSEPDHYDISFSWGPRTIQTLIKLGLLIPTEDRKVEISELGKRTWGQALSESIGDLFP